MNTKDYTRIAALIRRLPERMTKRQLIEALCLLFILDNPRFKDATFINACKQEGDTP